MEFWLFFMEIWSQVLQLPGNLHFFSPCKTLNRIGNVFMSSSHTKLYKMFLTQPLKGRLVRQPVHANLNSSVLKFCHKNISLVKFICDKADKSKCKTLMEARPECGLAIVV